MSRVERLRRYLEMLIPPIAKHLGVSILGEHVLLIHPIEDAWYTRIGEPDDLGRFMRVLFPVAMIEDCAIDKLPDLVDRMLSDAQRKLMAT